MTVFIRQARENDLNDFIKLSGKLSSYNRERHDNSCKTDDFQKVSKAKMARAEKTFLQRSDDILILIAEVEEKVCGYALARIIHEEPWVDNGTGRMGLFDELYIDESARGLGLGQKMIDEVMVWMKQTEIIRVKLFAYSWNAHAKKIYESNGFKEYAVSYEVYI
jgi:ribosomal protein S18 acetylase RimI-like enzyme